MSKEIAKQEIQPFGKSKKVALKDMNIVKGIKKRLTSPKTDYLNRILYEDINNINRSNTMQLQH